MAALSFLDLNNEITPQVLTLLHYFAKDTTDRILRNVQRLNLNNSGTLQSSIAATVYYNAGGNDALIRFYYMNYAGYLEQGLGYLYGIDDDLTTWSGSKGNRKRKMHGVKAANVRPVDAISGSEFGPIPATIRKSTRSPKGDARRGQAHKARPFLHSEIRLHLRATQKRLAMLLAYTATAYLTRGMVMATMQLVENEKYDALKVNERLNEMEDQRMSLSSRLKGNEKYSGFRFIADMGAEEAWLKAKGYLKHIERDWGFSSFSGETLR